MTTFTLSLGALAPSIADQLEQIGYRVTPYQAKHVQKDVDALNRLKVRGVLSDGEAKRACTRLMKMIAKWMEPIP